MAHKLPTIPVNGELRILAQLPSKKDHKIRTYKGPTIPRTKWKDTDWGTLFMPFHWDQNGQGSCCGHAGAAALSSSWVKQGNDPINFSPCFIYGNINDGQDEGSTIERVLDCLHNIGCCLETEVGPKNIYKRNWNQSVFETAKNYKCPEIYQARTFDEYVSGMLMGFSGVHGIDVGNAFEPNSDGYLPEQQGSAGGHALHGKGVRIKGSKIFVPTQNSWGRDWGADGCCYMPESYFQDEWVEMWLIRTVNPYGASLLLAT